MPAIQIKLLRPALWDLSQKIFGADGEKERIYGECLLGMEPATRVLDFGCATGNAASIFKAVDYTGIDIDPALIAWAELKFKNFKNMRFVAMDLFEFNPPQKFDRILFAGTAHHLQDDLFTKILLKLKTLLSPTGHIYFYDPVITGKESKLLKLLIDLDQGKFHRRFETYENLFQTLGFKISDKKTLQAQGTLFPQPQYGYFKLN